MLEPNNKLNFNACVKALASSFAVFLFLVGIRYTDQQNLENIYAAEASKAATVMTKLIERRLDESLILTEALAGLVQLTTNPTQEQFDQFTNYYTVQHPQVISLQLAPDGVVKFVTNYDRNKGAIGHDLLKGDNARISAFRAAQTGEKIAVGPVNLLQGGRALIVRQPLLNKSGQFWGFATVLVDFDNLLSQEFSQTQMNYFAIRSVNELGEPGNVFFGDNTIFDESYIETSLNYGPNAWEMALSNKFIESQPKIESFVLSKAYWAAIVMISLVVLLISYKLFNRRYELELAVDQATESLAHAVDTLKTENTKRNQLYGMIAHELRTPVSVIHMLSEDSTSINWEASRNTVYEQSTALLDTLDDMRLMINPNLERPIRNTNFTVDQVCDQVKRGTASLLSSCGMSLFNHVNLIPENRMLEYSTDTYRLRTAIINLIRNACLHSEGSRVDLTWTVDDKESNNKSLIVKVIDNGKGIPTEKAETLFSMYARGDTQSEGTGLGLYIARNWLEQVGGTLNWIPSSSGTTFCLTVPLTAALAHNEEVDTLNQIDTAKKQVSKMRLLFVEDDPTLHFLGCRFFRDRAKSVDAVKNTTEALELLCTNHYDMVVTDFFLPDLNGDELIKQARLLGFKNPIVGVTAATLGNQFDILLKAGANAVIAKPLDSERFFNAVASLNLELETTENC